ncbi:MAG: ABC transporter permease subunit, partial [Okeania sp. SIO2H7]|nr:ABC transporter permease subunit [Okeania sp. SIO2H7]
MSDNSQEKIPLWRDDRFWRVALQVLAVAIFVALIIWLAINFSRSEQGGRINFSFLNKAASFGIGEGLIPYNPSDPYKQALLVGLVNSLRITVLGIILTTILGIAAGIASFSENWLLKQLNRVYVEVVRNTPLLLQLFFWYFAVFFNLPSQDKRIEWLDSIYMSKSGVILPWPENKLMVWLWLIVLVGGAIASIFIWRWRTKLMVERGVSGRPQLISLIVIGIAALLIIIFA